MPALSGIIKLSLVDTACYLLCLLDINGTKLLTEKTGFGEMGRTLCNSVLNRPASINDEAINLSPTAAGGNQS